MKEINILPPPPTSVEVLTPSALAEVFYFSRSNSISSAPLAPLRIAAPAP